MRIKIMSRVAMAYYKRNFPELLTLNKIISINDPEDGALFDIEHPNLLSLSFHDISCNTLFLREDIYTLFDTSHAKEVINFIRSFSQGDNILVHCFAGVSRSGAIGTFIREVFNTDYDEFKKTNPQIVPNTHVLKVLREVYYTDIINM